MAPSPILHLLTTTSTMDDARRLVEQGDTTTQIVMADAQTASRGRHNRPWLTFGAPYSLQATYILHPAVGPHLPLIVALALHEAVLAHTNGQNLSIKWPNDLLLNGKKLAGILCQNIGAGVSLIGIGLNISPPAEIPTTFQGTFLTTPNAAIPTPQSLAEVIAACLTPLIALYGKEGWSQSLHNSYLQRCTTIGQNIRWKVPQQGGNGAVNQELTGLARGLTPSGHLEMVAEDGTVHVIHSGEIFDRSHE